jgi:hypothetical protein
MANFYVTCLYLLSITNLSVSVSYKELLISLWEALNCSKPLPIKTYKSSLLLTALANYVSIEASLAFKELTCLFNVTFSAYF